jgi:hypothetical protein
MLFGAIRFYRNAEFQNKRLTITNTIENGKLAHCQHVKQPLTGKRRKNGNAASRVPENPNEESQLRRKENPHYQPTASAHRLVAERCSCLAGAITCRYADTETRVGISHHLIA